MFSRGSRLPTRLLVALTTVVTLAFAPQADEADGTPEELPFEALFLKKVLTGDTYKKQPEDTVLHVGSGAEAWFDRTLERAKGGDVKAIKLLGDFYDPRAVPTLIAIIDAEVGAEDAWEKDGPLVSAVSSLSRIGGPAAFTRLLQVQFGPEVRDIYYKRAAFDDPRPVRDALDTDDTERFQSVLTNLYNLLFSSKPLGLQKIRDDEEISDLLIQKFSESLLKDPDEESAQGLRDSIAGVIGLQRNNDASRQLFEVLNEADSHVLGDVYADLKWFDASLFRPYVLKNLASAALSPRQLFFLARDLKIEDARQLLREAVVDDTETTTLDARLWLDMPGAFEQWKQMLESDDAEENSLAMSMLMNVHHDGFLDALIAHYSESDWAEINSSSNYFTSIFLSQHLRTPAERLLRDGITNVGNGNQEDLVAHLKALKAYRSGDIAAARAQSSPTRFGITLLIYAMENDMTDEEVGDMLLDELSNPSAARGTVLSNALYAMDSLPLDTLQDMACREREDYEKDVLRFVQNNDVSTADERERFLSILRCRVEDEPSEILALDFPLTLYLDREHVPYLIACLDEEVWFVESYRQTLDHLWRLTGERFGTDSKLWREWWEAQ